MGLASRQKWVAENDGALGFVLVVLLRVFLVTPVVHSAKPFTFIRCLVEGAQLHLKM